MEPGARGRAEVRRARRDHQRRDRTGRHPRRASRQAVPGQDLELVGRMRSLDASAIPWDGPEARLIVHDGHAPGHGAVFLPESGVLIAGDMCSDVEIPLLDTDAADPLGDYRTGMERLASVPGVRQVVPGHGHIGDAAELRRRLALDAAYLDAVSAGQAVRRSEADAGQPGVDAGHARRAGAVLQGLASALAPVRQKILSRGPAVTPSLPAAAAPTGAPRPGRCRTASARGRRWSRRSARCRDCARSAGTLPRRPAA